MAQKKIAQKKKSALAAPASRPAVKPASQPEPKAPFEPEPEAPFEPEPATASDPMPSGHLPLEEIRELIRMVTESKIAELELQRGGSRVRIQTQAPPPRMGEMMMSYPMPSMPYPAAPPPVAAPVEIPAKPVEEQAQPLSNEVIVKSPIVGTFYEAPSPDSPVFVKVGDPVEPGKVLCIIESMKLMNEIEAEIRGTITSKLVTNGQPVEYGEALFGITPL